MGCFRNVRISPWRGRAYAVQVLAMTVLAAGLTGLASSAATAQERPQWQGDIRHFQDRDLERWRQGHWYHGGHEGRAGWWWVVGDLWYFYPAPIYPYPNPYQPPATMAAVPPTPPAQYYYCDSPPGYYPYVPDCKAPWRVVPAQPSG